MCEYMFQTTNSFLAIFVHQLILEKAIKAIIDPNSSAIFNLKMEYLKLLYINYGKICMIAIKLNIECLYQFHGLTSYHLLSCIRHLHNNILANTLRSRRLPSYKHRLHQCRRRMRIFESLDAISHPLNINDK